MAQKEEENHEGLDRLTQFILKGARELQVNVLESMALPPTIPGEFDGEVREWLGVTDAHYPKQGLAIAAAILFTQPSIIQGVKTQEPQEFSSNDLNDLEIILASSYFDPHNPWEAIEFGLELAKKKHEDPGYLNRVANRRRDILNLAVYCNVLSHFIHLFI